MDFINTLVLLSNRVHPPDFRITDTHFLSRFRCLVVTQFPQHNNRKEYCTCNDWLIKEMQHLITDIE